MKKRFEVASYLSKELFEEGLNYRIANGYVLHSWNMRYGGIVAVYNSVESIAELSEEVSNTIIEREAEK